MNRRTDFIISGLTIAALVVFACAVVMDFAGHVEGSTIVIVNACFFMLCAVYLEVYSHRE